MLSDALDFLVLILVIGIVTGSSLNLTLPLVEESRNIRYDEIYDKTAEAIVGEQSNKYTGDGCMAYDELILTIISQTYFMPSPRVMDVCGEPFSMMANRVDMTQPGDILGGQIYDADGNPITLPNAIEFTPKSVDIGNWARDRIDAWYKASIFNGVVPIDEVRFSVEYTLGTSESKADDMYAVYVLCQLAGDTEPKLHRCLNNGQLK